MTPLESATAAPASAPFRHRGPATLGLVLLLLGAALAGSVDVVRTGYGLKGDEATYVAMALSAAYDRDLTFERQDLVRFWGIYRSGPEGIFLKRGKTIGLRARGHFPWLRIARGEDPRSDRLYFGKAYIYPLVAAPFVRLLGLNGLLLLNVLLLAAAGACAYLFLAADSSPTAAAAFASAFIGAAAVPVYTVFLTPEIFNFSVVFVAMFLWVYDPVAPGPERTSGRRQAAAAVLLGLATYSKPSNALLIAPLVLAAWWQRRWLRGIVLGAVFVATTTACFGLTAAVSGEFNYQGGDRKTFYTTFPFDGPGATWERRGISVRTDGSAAQKVLEPAKASVQFAHNVEYFLVGRHFGFVPYFFPGLVAIGLWLASRARRDSWRLLLFLTVFASALVLVLLLPYTWSGGGGPPGNRYFLSIYPALFFLTPPLASAWPGLVAWVGGALFTVKMLLNPFVAAKFPYQTTERGAARHLPVELTMANDLPIMLYAPRAHLRYGDTPESSVLLYFLDENAYTPEPTGFMWVSGNGRSDIVVRADRPVHALRMTITSPIRTTFTASAGGPSVDVPLAPGETKTFDLPVRWVRGLQEYVWLLSVRSSDAFIPRLESPTSTDGRNLGVRMRFAPIADSDGYRPSVMSPRDVDGRAEQ
ncbi:MAG: hypothetical protein ACM3SQ_19465 [Betaproteobacteria bacterium]